MVTSPLAGTTTVPVVSQEGLRSAREVGRFTG